ncbi:4'-phosphopantetheinyl transferase family protein [Leifsonia sp. AG29]|uniref:4'-phosphopantetheinyl transferase family protein n=1 Tax=Leifsonia sp. AG29 TaxID=2598860 RepID=UPI001E4B7C76|nr:hypothetical protein [Leifsonia sp. AG29]
MVWAPGVVSEVFVVRHGDASEQIAVALSEGDRDRLASLRGCPRGAFLAGREALLRAARAHGAGADARITAICPDCGLSHGRPVLAEGALMVHVALTHSAGSAYAVAATLPVGIDAEPVDTAPDRLSAIEAMSPGRGDPLRRWTAVEAVLKADGRGLRVDPARVDVRRSRARLDSADYGLRTWLADRSLVTIAVAMSEVSR